jgi:hypothetical protein
VTDLFLRLWDVDPVLAIISVMVVFLFGGSILAAGVKIRNWILGRRGFPSREQIYEHQQPVSEAMKVKLIGLFRQAREIAIEYKKVTEELNTKVASCLEDGNQDIDLYNLGMEIGQLPYRVVRDQMAQADDLEEAIRDIALRNFLKLQKEANGGKRDGLMAHPATKLYDAILKHSLNVAKSKVRTLFQENHLAEMSTAEAEAKFTERADQIGRLVSAIHNDMWPGR